MAGVPWTHTRCHVTKKIAGEKVAYGYAPDRYTRCTREKGHSGEHVFTSGKSGPGAV